MLRWLLPHHYYLNQDGSYVIVQTGGDRVTQTFAGTFVAHGASGFCIQPQRGTQRKCFSEMPASVGKELLVTSDLNEVVACHPATWPVTS